MESETKNNQEDVKIVIDQIRSKPNEEELEKYIKEIMSQLRFSSLATGVRICSQMVLDICDNDKLGMREKLKGIRRFCKTGLEGKKNDERRVAEDL